MSELKPCPFCGGEAKLHYYKSGDFELEVLHDDDCILTEIGDSVIFGSETFQYAVKAWNTRHERTCHVESSFLNDFSSEHECWWEFDLSCGHHVIGDMINAPNYCEVCGARVVA